MSDDEAPGYEAVVAPTTLPRRLWLLTLLLGTNALIGLIEEGAGFAAFEDHRRDRRRLADPPLVRLPDRSLDRSAPADDPGAQRRAPVSGRG